MKGIVSTDVKRMNSVHGLERNEQWYCTVGELYRSWVWGGCEIIIVAIFQNIFGVPRCTIKYLFVVTSSVRGEVCVRWVKTPDTCTQTVVRLYVEFFFYLSFTSHAGRYTHKTAVIERELSRLQMDIVAFQENRLPETWYVRECSVWANHQTRSDNTVWDSQLETDHWGP